MLDFAIFAVTFVIFLLVLVFYLYPGSKSQTTIPGMDPSDPKEGNLSDILQAGSFQSFLDSLHEQYGPISSFYMGTTLVVSLADPALFEQHQQIFDKPAELYDLYKAVIGDRSILFVNGVEGRKQHKLMEKLLDEMCLLNIDTFHKLSKEVAEKWQAFSSDQHVPVYQYMVALCVKICTKILFGNYFNDEKNILNFSRTFEICWTELEARAGGSVPEKGSPQDKQFEEAVQQLRHTLQNAAKDKSSEKTLFGILSDGNMTEQQVIDNAMMVILKYYSIVAFLTWTIYFLATHDDIQEKVYKELHDVLGATQTVDDVSKLRYLRQVLDETLRVANIEPWTARVQDIDIEIGGHVIPKKTPVIHAIGVVLHNDKYWTLPKVFDPDRFDSSNVKLRPQLAFQPFGFAGKRHCPGRKWTYTQAMIILSILCRNFKMKLVEGQVVTPYSRIVTRPEEEMWITLVKRK